MIQIYSFCDVSQNTLHPHVQCTLLSVRFAVFSVQCVMSSGRCAMLSLVLCIKYALIQKINKAVDWE